jgi:hypothetical protein
MSGIGVARIRDEQPAARRLDDSDGSNSRLLNYSHEAASLIQARGRSDSTGPWAAFGRASGN